MKPTGSVRGDPGLRAEALVVGAPDSDPARCHGLGSRAASECGAPCLSAWMEPGSVGAPDSDPARCHGLRSRAASECGAPCLSAWMEPGSVWLRTRSQATPLAIS